MKAKKQVVKENGDSSDTSRKVQLKQSDVPSLPQIVALRVAEAIFEHYAGQPVTPLQLAKGLNLTTTSSYFRKICGASSAYGLTEGSYTSALIRATPLSKQIIKPTFEGEDNDGRKASLLKPRVFKEFLTKYDQALLPRQDIAQNVLEDLGVPTDRTASVYEMLIDGAASVGLIEVIKDKKYVNLNGVQHPKTTDETIPDSIGAEDAPLSSENDDAGNAGSDNQSSGTPAQMQPDPSRARRVFITHGKNQEFIEPIKKLLGFGELIPVVSVEKQSVSKPVPDKVMEDMRSCGAAIIHVSDELKLIDQDAHERVMINENVLIEIGAAMALYGRRFILLVKDGIKLPSNLQGIFEVRYREDRLDGDATIRLLEAINDIKNNPLP